MPDAPARASSDSKGWLTAIAVGAALTAAMTFPTVRSIGTLGRINAGDGRFSIWNIGWVAHALTEDPAHLLDANIFYPHAGTLAYSELNLVAGVLAAPAYRLTHNAVAALNSAILAALFLSFLAMWALVRRLSGSPGAALVAAAGYTFSSYTAAHTAQVQLMMIFGFPLALLALHRLAARPTLLSGVWLGLALTITGLSSGYYGLAAGVMVAIASLIWAQTNRAYWIALAVALATTAALVGPVLYLFVSTRAAAGAPSAAPASELRLFAASWSEYFRSGTIVGGRALEIVSTAAHAVFPNVVAPPRREVLFPGFVIGLLGLAGIIHGLRDRGSRLVVLAMVAIAIAGVWASFGPAGRLFPMLMTVIPGGRLARASARFGFLATFALAVLSGVELKRFKGTWVIPFCLLLVVAELWVPWPLETMPPPESAYTRLRELPRGGVVELPFPYVRTDFHQHTRAMARSIVNWQPLVNGYSDFTPADFNDIAVPINGFPDQASFDIMRERGVKYVIVRLPDYGATEYRRAMRARFPPFERYLRRLTSDGDVWLLEIVDWPNGASSTGDGTR